MNKLKALLKSQKETVLYFICGCCTVCVNTGSFLFLALLFSEIKANTMAFFISTMFAYFSNTMLVFQKKISWRTFGLFWGLRIGTIFLDNGGLLLLLIITQNKFYSKLGINIGLIALNYLFSKFIIYRSKR